MFRIFQQRVSAEHSADDTKTPATESLIRPASALELLSTPRRSRLVDQIWQRTSLSRAQFAHLYRAPIERYAALVQHFPASEAHHHAYLGGMLDHALEAMACALKLRQSHLLPVGAPAETQAEQAEAWTAAVACCSLLHDIGKIAVDLHVEYDDGRCWHPWHGPLTKPYRFRYRKDRIYRLHDAATGLLYRDILDRTILDWLSSYSELWGCLLHAFAGQYEHAGMLGELVKQADQASTAQQLGGDPDKARTAPRHALQRKLLDGLRYLVREALKLNQPQASDGWLTEDGLWLVAKTVCDKLRAHLLSQGIEGIPESNIAVFNVLQDHGLAQITPDGKAIWKATVTSVNGWTHSFTFLKLSPSLIWETDERPDSYDGSVRVEGTVAISENAVPAMVERTEESASSPLRPGHVASTANLFEPSRERKSASSRIVLPGAPNPAATASIERTEDHPVQGYTEVAAGSDNQHGIAFITWLRDSIAARRLRINEARALVHTVADTAFLVTPGLFQRYAQEHPELATQAKKEKTEGWQWAQKMFERLKMHKKQQNGLNIWTCEVAGPRKSRHLHGYLLNDATVLFGDVPPNNPYLRLR